MRAVAVLAPFLLLLGAVCCDKQPDPVARKTVDEEVALVQVAYRAVVTGAAKGQLRRYESSADCHGDPSHVRLTLWTDDAGTIRQFTTQGTGRDGTRTLRLYYDAYGKLRFTLASRDDGHGPAPTDRRYYSGDGVLVRHIAAAPRRGSSEPDDPRTLPAWDPATSLQSLCRRAW